MEELPQKVIIRCQDGEEFDISRISSTSNSRVLESFINFSEGRYLIIQVPLPADQVRQVIRFMEGNDPQLTTVNNAMDIYLFSKEYEIGELQKLCENHIIRNISIQNVCSVYDFACNQKERNIQYNCWKLFDSSWIDIFQQHDFQFCNETTIMTFLSRPEYESLTEVELLEAVYEWAVRRLERKYDDEILDMNNEEFRYHVHCIMVPFLPMIRFLTMTENEIYNRVLNLKLLSRDEIKAIFFLLDKDDKCVPIIPETICLDTRKRTPFIHDSLFEYKNRQNFGQTEDYPLSQRIAFKCEVLVSYDCFLDSIILPINHHNSEGIPVLFEGHSNSEEDPFALQYFNCDISGNAALTHIIFLQKESISSFSIKVPNEELNDFNNIVVIGDAKYFANDEEFNRLSLMPFKQVLNQLNRIYFDVNLYF